MRTTPYSNKVRLQGVIAGVVFILDGAKGLRHMVLRHGATTWCCFLSRRAVDVLHDGHVILACTKASYCNIVSFSF